MKKHMLFSFLIVLCALIFNALPHQCHESHDDHKILSTSSLTPSVSSFSINVKKCAHEIECPACATRSAYSIPGLLSNPRLSLKKLLNAPIFTTRIRNFQLKRIHKLNSSPAKIPLSSFIEFITTIIIRQ